MKRFLRTLAIAAVSVALVAPMADAQSRGGSGRHGGASQSGSRGGASTHQSSPGSRGGSREQARPAPGNNRQPTGQSNSRPSQSKAQQYNPGNNGRPQGNPGNQGGGNRPGNKPGNQPGYTPGGNNHGGNNGGGGHGYNPGGNNRPQGNPGNPGGNKPGNTSGYHPNHVPGHGPSAGRPHGPRPGMTPPPPRPGRPVYHPWTRPVPPPTWRPGPRAPYFRTFLGVALGVTVQATIDALWHSGYYVSGYDNGMVYINDVNELGFFWPNAVMMYNNYGGLCGAQFYYQTAYNDTYRFQSVFNTLCRSYGYPQVNTAGQAIWYGRDGSYISLTYGNRPSSYGPAGFYTTLTFGN